MRFENKTAFFAAFSFAFLQYFAIFTAVHAVKMCVYVQQCCDIFLYAKKT